MCQTVNPLLVPEIIDVVGHYLMTSWEEPKEQDPWKPKSTYFQARPNRKNILSATKVCRVWRDVLTPLCWVAFDDYVIYHKEYPPSEMLAFHQKNLPSICTHFRFIKLNNIQLVEQADVIQSTKVQELEASLWTSGAKDLVKFIIWLNPGLSILDLNLSYTCTRRHDLWPALATLTKLKILRLENVKFGVGDDGDQSWGFIQSNEKLEELSLIEIGKIGFSLEFRLSPLLKLRKLLVKDSNVLCDMTTTLLLAQSPNLEELEVDGCKDYYVCWMTKFESFCPKVRRIRIPTTGALDRDVYWLLEMQCSKLVEICVAMKSFSASLRYAVSCHASTLEVLRLVLEEESDCIVENTKMILESGQFSQLQILSISICEGDVEDVGEWEHWFDDDDIPWHCPNLVRIQFESFRHPRKMWKGGASRSYEEFKKEWGDSADGCLFLSRENDEGGIRMFCEKPARSAFASTSYSTAFNTSQSMDHHDNDDDDDDDYWGQYGDKEDEPPSSPAVMAPPSPPPPVSLLPPTVKLDSNFSEPASFPTAPSASNSTFLLSNPTIIIDEDDDDAYWRKYGEHEDDEEADGDSDSEDNESSHKGDRNNDEVMIRSSQPSEGECMESFGFDSRRIFARLDQHHHHHHYEQQQQQEHKQQFDMPESLVVTAPIPTYGQVDPTTLASLLQRLVLEKTKDDEDEEDDIIIIDGVLENGDNKDKDVDEHEEGEQDRVNQQYHHHYQDRQLAEEHAHEHGEEKKPLTNVECSCSLDSNYRKEYDVVEENVVQPHQQEHEHKHTYEHEHEHEHEHSQKHEQEHADYDNNYQVQQSLSDSTSLGSRLQSLSAESAAEPPETPLSSLSLSSAIPAAAVVAAKEKTITTTASSDLLEK
ncbi:hypothetical protein BG004_007738, partial [Podila humilis]